MNILLIGNGFDLAHGLPTRYGDFLEFCKAIKDIKEKGLLNDLTAINKEMVSSYQSLHSGIKLVLPREFGEELSEKSEELINLIYDNAWLKYFLQCDAFVGENWIDFESEISRVIQALDKAMALMKNQEDITKLSGNNAAIIKKIVEEVQKDDGKRLYIQEVLKSIQNLNSLKDILERDLNMLIRAFEIYLCEFVEKIEVKRRSSDIEGLEKIGYILSFNYTDTYRNIYDVNNDIEYDYFHGKAKISNNIETNSMVLGIDEYLTDSMKNENTDFIAFKKFYQRIYKGCKELAVNWCADIKKDFEYFTYSRKFMFEDQIGFELVSKENDNLYKWEQFEKLAFKYDKEYEEKHPKHNLYIFGHSLDVTDKDILRELILNDNVKTTIFYPDKKELGKKIANLVKVIGQDELIRRTGGNTKTIEFIVQQDMVEI